MDLWNVISSVPLFGPALPYVSALVTICAALSTVLPPAKASGWYANVRQAVNWIGLNLGHAKPATPAA